MQDDGVSRQFSLDHVKDSVSRDYSNDFGDGSGFDLCGLRSYELLEVINFQVVPPTFNVILLPQANELLLTIVANSNDIGEHKMVIKISLENYSATLSIPFLIEVTGCTIT